MTNAPVYGCDGCRGTAGFAGCPVHGRSPYVPVHVHDYQPYPHKAGPQRIYCRTCGDVINIEKVHREDAR